MRILIADDDKNLRKVLLTELSDEGVEVDEADSGTRAMSLIEQDDYDVLILDLSMPAPDGMEILKKMKTLEISAEAVILTAHATVSTAVEAMKLGAYDYLTKPFNVEELKAITKKAYEKKELHDENIHLKTQIKTQWESESIIGRNPMMLEILEKVKQVALSDFPVLVSGESGVGKELVAKAIHRASRRKDGPFIPINCGAIPENMLESELFGYEKGAFTGAYAKKLGLLEVADHGTLFLDEIGLMTLQLQGKLLRVVETGRFFRVGGTREIGVNVKFISATNMDIQKEVEQAGFRSDLFYRISTLTLHIPPLRERKEDIGLIVEHTIEKYHAFRNKKFSREALNLLSEYTWPGNVRELQNVVHRTLLHSKSDIIGPNELPDDIREVPASTGRRLEEIEKNHILRVLKEAGGQRGKAAEILGVDPKTLYRKLLSYGVTE